jgi:flagellar protein FliO/FliZ
MRVRAVQVWSGLKALLRVATAQARSGVKAVIRVAAVALAPVAANAATPMPVTDPIGPGSVLQLTLSLAAVVAAIFGLGWLLRRLHGLPGSTHRALKVIATLPVGTRERIAIIQAGETQVLIGLSPGRIQTLHVLEKPVGAAVGAASAAIGPDAIGPEGPPTSQFGPTTPFKSLLDRERAQCDS